MVLTATAFAALNSLKSLYEIVRDVRDTNDPEKLRLAAAQMLELVLTARGEFALVQEDNLALKSEIQTLRGEIKKVAEFDAAAQSYKRIRIGGGSFVYVEVAEAETDQGQIPYTCPTCFGDKVITIMQPTRNGSRGEYTCPKCGTEVE